MFKTGAVQDCHTPRIFFSSCLFMFKIGVTILSSMKMKLVFGGLMSSQVHALEMFKEAEIEKT